MLRWIDRIARMWPACGMLCVLMSAGCDKEPAGPVAEGPKKVPPTVESPAESPPPRLQPPTVEVPEKIPEKVREAIPQNPPAMRVETMSRPDPEDGPRVLLSEGHRETCRLTTEDVIPDVTVTDIEGTNHQLKRLLGDRLTVLLFWSEESPLAMEQFLRLPIDVLAEFAGQGVTVIAVNVGGEVPRVRELTGDASDKIVSLVDPEGALFSQFAGSLLPRTYLLDKDGTILWFDIEYSQSTERELDRALRHFLNDS